MGNMSRRREVEKEHLVIRNLVIFDLSSETLVFMRYLESEDRLLDLIVLLVTQHDFPLLGDLFRDSTKTNGDFGIGGLYFCKMGR